MTGIFFGSTTGTTESVAARIAERLGVAQADVHNVAAASVEDVKKYDLLLLGSSTWGSGELQDDWPGFLDKLGKEDLSGRRVALFGCGDAGIYSDTFCDAMAEIRDGLASTGCTFVGGFDAEEYPGCGSRLCQDGEAIGWAVVLKLVVMLGISERFVISVCAAGISVNLMLMAFNLIPIPPLDGGRILRGLLPSSGRSLLDRIEPYGMVILVVLMAGGGLGFFARPFLEAGRWLVELVL